MADIKYDYVAEDGRNFRYVLNKDGYFVEYEDGSREPMPRQRVPLRWQWKLRGWRWWW